jgi:hypothetical protein
MSDFNEPGYEKLAAVLQRAYDQAAKGKGKERHAAGEPFHEQVMQIIGARKFGVGSLLCQAFKKSDETQSLPLDRGVNELLGAIVYLAGAVIAREAEGDGGETGMEVQSYTEREAASRAIALAAGFVRNESTPEERKPQNAKVESDWIGWFGGVMPVPAHQAVRVRFRNGIESVGVAGHLDWGHNDNPYDIVTYRDLQT